MVSVGNKKAIFILVVIILVAVGGLWWYTVLQEETISTDLQPTEEEKNSATEPIQPSKSEEEISELISTESVVCGDKTYIFDTIFIEGKGYFNDIYKTFRSSENFVVRLKPSRGEDLGVFSFLTASKEDCDRLYLTTEIRESDAHREFIFGWKIGAKTVYELAVSKKFASYHVRFPYNQKVWISPDGERIIVVEQDEPTEKNQFCNNRTLYLLHLRKDISKILFQLTKTETFDNGTGDFDELECDGLNFGWLDNNTIYYDVYDATVEYNRPLIERRTLKIE